MNQKVSATMEPDMVHCHGFESLAASGRHRGNKPSTTASQTKRRPSLCAEFQQNRSSPCLSKDVSLLAFSNL